MRIYTLLTILTLLMGSVLAEDTAAPKETKQEKTIYLNFKDATLGHVIEYLARQKNIDLMPVKKLNNLKVTLTTHNALTLDQAWSIGLTLLEANNYSIINVDGLYRIVPKAKANKEPLPSYVGVDPTTLPDSDKRIRFVYLFKNMKASMAQSILAKMLEPNSVQMNDNLNACFISEKSLNIKAAMKIITELDLGGLRESIQIIKLKEASASDVEALFKNIIGDGAPKKGPRFVVPNQKKKLEYFSSSTRIIADNRNNTLILLGTRDNLTRMRNFIAKYIDVALDAPHSRLHIRELKYVDAEKIAPLLQSMIKPPVKGKKSLLIGKVKYFEDMIITAEKSDDSTAAGGAAGGAGGAASTSVSLGAGNRLLVTCNQDDWKRITQFIDQLDIPKPQVAMEILFVDVSLTGNKELSAQLRNKKPGQIGKGVNFQTQHIQSIPQTNSTTPALATELQNNMAVVPNIQASNSPPASFMTFGPPVASNEGGLWAAVKTVLSSDNINIITQPFLVSNNHETSSLKITDQRLVDGQISANSVTPVRKKVNVSADLGVNLTPHINMDGIINLVIDIDINEFLPLREGQSVADRTVRKVMTSTTMADGEVLVIGGLIQTKNTESIRKTPFFGDLPLIGNLFKGRTKVEEKKDLYIFIRPSLIKPRFEGKPGDYTQLKLDYARISIARSAALSSKNDPIQRWFFEPKKGDTYYDTRGDEFQTITNFTQAKHQPRSVRIAEDKYFRASTVPQLRKRRQLKEQIRDKHKLKERKTSR